MNPMWCHGLWSGVRCWWHGDRDQSGNAPQVGVSSPIRKHTDPVPHSNIQQCGPVLQHVIDHLARQTRWKISVLMGDPDPQDAEGGNIITRYLSDCSVKRVNLRMRNASLHTSKTIDGHDFAEVYPNFDTEVVEAFGEFLDHVYSKSTFKIWQASLMSRW